MAQIWDFIDKVKKEECNEIEGEYVVKPWHFYLIYYAVLVGVIYIFILGNWIFCVAGSEVVHLIIFNIVFFVVTSYHLYIVISDIVNYAIVKYKVNSEKIIKSNILGKKEIRFDDVEEAFIKPGTNNKMILHLRGCGDEVKVEVFFRNDWRSRYHPKYILFSRFLICNLIKRGIRIKIYGLRYGDGVVGYLPFSDQKESSTNHIKNDPI